MITPADVLTILAAAAAVIAAQIAWGLWSTARAMREKLAALEVNR